MSIPEDHHFVSRVHMKKFKSSCDRFLFLDKSGRFKDKASAKSEFYEKNLNSFVNTQTLEIDQKSIEDQLNFKWENPFNGHYGNILNFIKDASSIDDAELQASLKFFFEYGIVCRLRSFKRTTEYNQKETEIMNVDFSDFNLNDFVNKGESIEGLKTEEQRENFKSDINYLMEYHQLYSKKVKESIPYPASTITEVPFFVPEKCCYHIYTSENFPFILPDTTAMIKDSKKTTALNETEMNKIFSVSLPLSPSVFIEIINMEVYSGEINTKRELTVQDVLKVNEMLFEAAVSVP